MVTDDDGIGAEDARMGSGFVVMIIGVADMGMGEAEREKGIPWDRCAMCNWCMSAGGGGASDAVTMTSFPGSAAMCAAMFATDSA